MEVGRKVQVVERSVGRRPRDGSQKVVELTAWTRTKGEFENVKNS